MICNGCTARGRKPKGSRLAGYCDACGWALAAKYTAETRETSTSDGVHRDRVTCVEYLPELHPGIAPSAGAMVGTAEENRRLSLDWPGSRGEERRLLATLRGVATTIERHDPALAAHLRRLPTPEEHLQIHAFRKAAHVQMLRRTDP